MSLFDESESSLRPAASIMLSPSTSFSSPTSPNSASPYTQRIEYLQESLQAAAISSSSSTSSTPASFLTLLKPGTTLTQATCDALLDGMIEMWNDRNKYHQQAQQTTTDVDRLKSDLFHAQQRVSDLKDEKALLDKKLWETEMKRRTTEKEAQTKEKQMKVEMAAVEKKCIMIQRRDNQYKHEMRKVEQNYERIQEKLHKMITASHYATSNAAASNSLPNTPRIPSGSLSSSASTGSLNGVSSQTFCFEMTGSIMPTKGSASGVSSPSLGNSTLHSRHGSAITSSSLSSNPPVSSADYELLQQTLNNYNERMIQLVSENVELKQTVREFESRLQEMIEADVIEGLGGAAAANGENGENADPSNPNNSNGLSIDPSSPLDDSGLPIPRHLQCLSPRSRMLLTEFTPQLIELPWEMCGRNIQSVLRSKMLIVKEKIHKQTLNRAQERQTLRDESALQIMKSRVEELQVIINEQDVLLRAALYSSEVDQKEWTKENEENRRLSLRVEHEDWARRRGQAINGNGTATPSKASSSSSAAAAAAARARNDANPFASPTSLKILGGHSAANLPVFETPVFPKKNSIDDAPPSSLTSSLRSKSKWLQGGIVSQPNFTPRRVSEIRAEMQQRRNQDGAGQDNENDDEDDDNDEELDESFRPSDIYTEMESPRSDNVAP